MFSAFYPTSDFWFWVIERPPWEKNNRPASKIRTAFMQKVVWRTQHPFCDVGACADGLFFVEFPDAVGDALAADLDNADAVSYDQANLAFTVADRLVEADWGLALNLGGRGLTY